MFDWLISHKEDIAAVYGCVVALCTAIVKILPSNKSTKVWGTVVKALDYFSTAYTDSDAEKLKSKK